MLLLASLLAVLCAAAGEVRAAVEPLTADPRWGRAEIGLMVVHVASGDEIVAWRADAPMVPASTMKVVTAAAALRTLGPSHVFTTEAWATGEVVGGVLEGDLVIVGHGDPTLRAEHLWRLLRDLRADGLERVAGNVVLDASYFDEAPAIPGWKKPGDLADGPSYYAPIGALSVEFGGVTILARPGAEPGAPAVVALQTPAADAVRLTSALVTGAPRSRTRLDLERTVGTDHVAFHVSGTLPVDGSPRRMRRAVADPLSLFRGVLAELAREDGPRLDGTFVAGVRPDTARKLATITSPPLAAILMDTNKYSSNYMAEIVLRTLGAETAGEGTTARGLEVVRRHLDAIGVERDEAVLVNGSGLSYDARLSARALVSVLVDGARDPRSGPELVASLAIGGRDGTLDERLTDLPGQVRAKTGTLADVVGLAGFVEAADGEVYAFAFLANEIEGSIDALQDLADEVARRVAGGPGPSAAAPLGSTGALR